MNGYGRDVFKLILGLALVAWAAACSPTGGSASGDLGEEGAIGRLDASQSLDAGHIGDAGQVADAGVGHCVADADCADPDAICTDGICGWAVCQAVESRDAGAAFADDPANLDGTDCAKGLALMAGSLAGVTASILGMAAACAPTAGLGCAAGAAGLVASLIGYLAAADTVFANCPRCIACGVASPMQKVHDSLAVSLAAGELVYGGICGNPPPNQDCQEFRNLLNDLTGKKNALAAKLATCPWWTKL
ncbi:MAG TPA: hypothetical protein VKB80_04830 [Kofleriaceae bacterium]|nr:hypothetical protein [Kofleriaceae bacterium]